MTPNPATSPREGDTFEGNNPEGINVIFRIVKVSGENIQYKEYGKGTFWMDRAEWEVLVSSLAGVVMRDGEDWKPIKIPSAGDWRAIALELGRAVRNIEQLPPLEFGVRCGNALIKLRELDQELYDREVKGK